MDLWKITGNLGLILFEFQFYRQPVHTLAIQRRVEEFYYLSPKFFLIPPGHPAFIIFILMQSHRRGICQCKGKKCFFFASYTRPSLTSNLCYPNDKWMLHYILSVCAERYVKFLKENGPILTKISNTDTNIIIHLYLTFVMKNITNIKKIVYLRVLV